MCLPRLMALLLAVHLLCGCEKPTDGKIHITYWEKWTGAEGEAMQKVVDAFNRSQDRIVVDYLSVSNVDRKTVVAAAGGDPPDVAGLWNYTVYSFADEKALTPFDDFIRKDGYTPDQWLSRYYPIYGNMCRYRGNVWALPSSPTTIALHWNKQLFREAGLDPERPPRTIAELDAYDKKLLKRDASGAIIQVGFLPQEPGWWSWAFPQWFGGSLWDGQHITAGTDPRNAVALDWVQSFTRDLGLPTVQAFTAGFGGFGSPQTAFFSGKVAMVFQGVWLNTYIKQFAPGMDYGVAPWPVAMPGLDNFTVADADVLTIPRGAKHPAEAWEFIKYVNSTNPDARSREELVGMELLCFLHERNSPIKQWSPYFEQHHPHPYVKVFRALAESPHAIQTPKMGIWQQYSGEIGNAIDNVRTMRATPEEALGFCQRRMSEAWAWHQRRLERRDETASK